MIDRLAITLHLDEFENGVRELVVPALDMVEEVLFPLHEGQLQKGVSADPGEVEDNVRCRQDRRSYALRPFHVLTTSGLGT